MTNPETKTDALTQLADLKDATNKLHAELRAERVQLQARIEKINEEIGPEKKARRKRSDAGTTKTEKAERKAKKQKSDAAPATEPAAA